MAKRRWAARAVLLVSCAASSVGARAAEGTYKLGPEDRVRISVYEWRASRGEPYEWTALKGEFTVNASGTLSLPLIGEVRAASETPDQLAAAISDRLQTRVGLAQRPDAAVEVVQYRPFYILGGVTKPGDYPYRPGLTVLQAVGVAGGFYRPFDPGLLRIQREAIASRGDLRLLDAERDALFARRARLQAELNDAETVPAPPELAKRQASPAVAQALRDEQSILQFRRHALRSQLASLEQGKTLLGNEVDTLRAKDAAQERQLALARRELEIVNGLVGKGLAIAPRQVGAEQAVIQLESARQDLQLTMLRARQDISKADRDALELRNRRQTEVANDLRQVEMRLQDIAGRAETAERLTYDTEVTAPQVLAERMRSDVTQPVYSILRRDGGEPREIAVTETTAVEPGDIVRVERRDPAGDGRPVPSVPRIAPSAASPAPTTVGQASIPAVPDLTAAAKRPAATNARPGPGRRSVP